VEEVQVEVQSRGEVYLFTAKKWLDASKGISEIELTGVLSEKRQTGLFKINSCLLDVIIFSRSFF